MSHQKSFQVGGGSFIKQKSRDVKGSQNNSVCVKLCFSNKLLCKCVVLSESQDHLQCLIKKTINCLLSIDSLGFV